jgi:hypothetical protein
MSALSHKQEAYRWVQKGLPGPHRYAKRCGRGCPAVGAGLAVNEEHI